MIENFLYTLNRGCGCKSILLKSYNFINYVLNRNIGNVNYANKGVYELLGSGINVGRVVHTGDVDIPVVLSVTERRRSVDNYLTYAKYVNPHTVEKVYAKKFGSVVFSDLLYSKDNAANVYSNEHNLEFDPYDPLSRESGQYITFVNAKWEEKNETQRFVHSAVEINGKTIPHQLSSGYTYGTLGYSRSVGGFSIQNGDWLKDNTYLQQTFDEFEIGKINKESIDKIAQHVKNISFDRDLIYSDVFKSIEKQYTEILVLIIQLHMIFLKL